MQKILTKLSEIQSEVERMEKDGTNQFQNYKYLSETQLTYQMKTLFDKHKVLFTYSSEITNHFPVGKEGKQMVTEVKIKYRFYDSETGEFLEGEAAGQGADSGDKGIYKAITGAIKYIYMKTFNIPTGDDPENDKGGRGRYAKPKSVIEAEGDPLLDDED